LKQMLHGIIEANTDYYVTQSGACSFFSGVDAFSGYPPNGVLYTGVANMGIGRFAEYNSTSTIAPYTGGSIVELGAAAKNKEVLNAGALFRLPFPMNPLMWDGTPDYHTGVMDFDLDPGRAGAGAGFWSYAPGHPPAQKTILSQFVGGMSRLADRGEISAQGKSTVIPHGAYGPTRNNTSELFLTFWRALNVERYSLMIPIPLKQKEIIKRLSVTCSVDDFFDTSDYVPLMLIGEDGIEVEDGTQTNAPYSFLVVHDALPNNDAYRWTAPFDLEGIGTQAKMMMTWMPGSVMEFYYTNNKGHREDVLSGQIHFLFEPDVASAQLQSTAAIVDTQEAYSQDATWRFGAHINDLIIMPFGSSSSQRIRGWQQYIAGASYQDFASYAMSISSLKGLVAAYPTSWTPATITALETLFQASSDHLSRGRGLYLGSDTERYNMSVLVPGSGSSLNELCTELRVFPDSGTEVPDPLPYMPGDPMFASSNGFFLDQDHGGPVAYSCFGAIIRPLEDDYKNQAVLQITGGPNGGTSQNKSGFSADQLHGTAIDAFWPRGRPILKSKK